MLSVFPFFVFIGLAYAIFGKMWADGYAVKPCNLRDPARFQASYYWNLYRKLHPHSYVPELCVACVVLTFAYVVFEMFYISD